MGIPKLPHSGMAGAERHPAALWLSIARFIKANGSELFINPGNTWQRGEEYSGAP